jgi:hypothetical protein
MLWKTGTHTLIHHHGLLKSNHTILFYEPKKRERVSEQVISITKVNGTKTASAMESQPHGLHFKTKRYHWHMAVHLMVSIIH